MKYLYVLLIYAFSLFALPAEALVAQRASSALRSDNFVDTGSSSSGRSSFSSSSKREDRKQQIEAAKQKRKAAHEKFLNKNKNTRTKASAARKQEADRDTAPAETLNSTEYKKQLASRFPKAISGYITIEQENLPRRIVISKDAVIQLELDAKESAFWFTQVNENILSVQKNEINDGKTIIVLQPTMAGSSRVILDFISQNGNDYKVLTTKRFNIIVDG